MWIDRQTVDDLRVSNAAAQVECRVLAEQNKVLQTILDWVRMRVNQLEKERAVLLFNTTKLSFPVPEMAKIDIPVATHATPQDNADATAPSFDDPGDEIAAKMGISHRPDGTLSYSR